MSERGSFVTEFIYCERCLSEIEKILCHHEKYFHGIKIPHWSEPEKALPIIAGKIGGLYPTEELHVFETLIMPKIAAVICHKLRIAVIADEGEEMFTIYPVKDGE